MNRVVVALAILGGLPGVQAASAKSLDVYFLDMHGGGSTLIVTPLGESVLIDTGSLEPKHRDVDRMHRACKHAGLRHIDYLVTTHFHSDHYGGLLELTRRIPIKDFLDKGAPPPEHEQRSKSFKQLWPLYLQATGGQVDAIRAGEDITLKNDPAGKIAPIRLHCVAAENRVEGFDGDIDALVAGFEIKRPDRSDNGRSVALLLTYGDFELFAGGDITWNVEHHLAHPVNRIGRVDLYQVTHHGLDQSNNTLLLKALSPTVCVAMNGPRKGIMPRTFGDLKALPDVKAIYQIHTNTQYGETGNTAPEFIANKDNADKGEYVKASVHPDKGIFTIQIGPEGEKRAYTIR